MTYPVRCWYFEMSCQMTIFIQNQFFSLQIMCIFFLPHYKSNRREAGAVGKRKLGSGSAHPLSSEHVAPVHEKPPFQLYPSQTHHPCRIHFPREWLMDSPGSLLFSTHFFLFSLYHSRSLLPHFTFLVSFMKKAAVQQTFLICSLLLSFFFFCSPLAARQERCETWTCFYL